MNFKQLPALPHVGDNAHISGERSSRFTQPVPGWQGMMYLLHKGCDHPGKSDVVFLPMIDIYPGDKTCILSTREAQLSTGPYI